MKRKNFVHTLARFWEIYRICRRAQHARQHEQSLRQFRATTISWLRGQA